MPLEGDIEQFVREEAEKLDWLSIKLNVHGNRGISDVLFIKEGPIFVLIEFKQPGKKPEPIQDFWLRTLRKLGVWAYWADNPKTALRILEMAEQEQNKNLITEKEYQKHCEQCGRYMHEDRWVDRGS